jgi:predicted esterase
MILAAVLLALVQPISAHQSVRPELVFTDVPRTSVRPELVEGLPFLTAAKGQDSASTSPARTELNGAAGRILRLPDEAIAYVPAGASAHPPLLVLLHGAGRGSGWMIRNFQKEADKRGIVLLAPTSRGPTWDAIPTAMRAANPQSALDEKLGHRFSRSRDSDRVEAAIEALGKQVPVDRSRTVLAGFSDGATFALAMGLSRRRAFAAVIAWSPGIAIESASPLRGRRVFVSHGRADPTLRFEVTSGEIVPLLEDEGAEVTFVPFDGVHEVPAAAKDAFLDAAFGGARQHD